MFSFILHFILRHIFPTPCTSWTEAWRQQKIVRRQLWRENRHCSYIQTHLPQKVTKSSRLLHQLPLSEYHDLLTSIEQCRQWERDILVRGQVTHFAKTSGSSSWWRALREKRIPVPVKSMKTIDHQMMKIFFHHYLTLYPTSRLFIGKTLTINSGINYDEAWRVMGYISWILASQTPRILEELSRRPSMDIASIAERQDKKDAIMRQIQYESITCIAGVTAWILDILASYGEKHDQGQRLQTFGHCELIFIWWWPAGDYKEKINAIFDHYHCPRPRIANCYNASEWSYAIQMDNLDDPHYHDMRLITNNDIYYEFIAKERRLSASNISDLREKTNHLQAHILTLDQVEKNTNYVIIQSSSRGLWRYIIGDVIAFVDNPIADVPTIRHQGRLWWHSNITNEHMEAWHVVTAVESAKTINPTLHTASFLSWPRELNKEECLTYQQVWPLFQYVFLIETDTVTDHASKIIGWELMSPEETAIALSIHESLKKANSNYERLSTNNAKIVPPRVKLIPHGTIRHYAATHKKILSPQWSIPLLREDNREWFIQPFLESIA